MSSARGTGLDFGTTTTLVASTDGVIVLGDRTPWMSSLVGYDASGGLVAGVEEEAAAEDRTVRSIKRAITSGEQNARLTLDDGPRDVPADTVMTAILAEAARRGASNGVDLTRPGAVRLGCPAMWDGRQRRRLLAIAESAGIPVGLADLIDEPVAAGIAWLTRQRPDSSAPLRVVVFDMGGGTLDVAVLDVRGSSARDVSVLAAIGSTLAGDALDAAIAEDIESLLDVDTEKLANPRRARGRVADAAREAKVALTADTEFVVSLPARLFGERASAEVTYSRDRLEAAFKPLMDRAEETVIAALRTARLTELEPGSPHDIRRVPLGSLLAGVDVVVLSGGMARVPYLAQRLRGLFGESTVVEPAIEYGADDLALGPECAVVLGLARAGEYGRINMFRPALDIWIEWADQSRLLYQAYTPVVAPWQTFVGGSHLRYVRNGLDLDLPRGGTGQLRVVSYTGGASRATLGGKSLDGFPVALCEQQFEFSLYPNGRLRMVDGAGEFEGQLDDWHVMVGADHDQRLARLVEPRLPEPTVEYPFNMERADPFSR
ncbi:MAG TPA: Hsp70 family protein [Micromonosporaceae bacterium]|jgi:molecular chaperone DnaK (HSP70)